MKLGYIAYRNMVSKPLNLVLSLLLLLLSVSLTTFVLQLSEQLGGQLSKNIAPFDMVVGAKGSPLQLVLSSVLHIDVPTGNIKLRDVAGLQKHPFVQNAIPVSYGDNYKGFRILGTEPIFLDTYNAVLSEGELYQKPFEITAGANVAQKLELTIGETFLSSHGLVASGASAHDGHPFVIKGILEPTGTVVDQLLITNLESIWDVHDHEENEQEETGHSEEEIGEEESHEHKHGHKAHTDEAVDHGKSQRALSERDGEKEITALLVNFKSPLGMVQLPRSINENTTLQAALPGFEIQRLKGLLGKGVQTVNGIALAILLVSGFSIFLSLLKTIRERRPELALLRTYGLSRWQLLGLAVWEGAFLGLMGFILGWFLGRVGIWGVSQYLQNTYGYAILVKGPEWLEFYLLGITLILAFLATLLASRSIVKLDVVKTLSDG